ncbi:MAG: hypothetical protein AAFY60_13500, partial [Myxococcota bacterium]
ESELSPVLLEDILASFRPFERMAEPVELGGFGGQVDAIELDPADGGSLRATLSPDPFSERYQMLFDHQQDQLVRMAKRSGLKLPFDSTSPLRLGTQTDEGAGLLVVEFRS